jgi:RimJ/RimL family protein N-acetyltransferase
MAEAFADPAIRRYNGAHDRLGRPAPTLSIEDAEAIIDEFASSWRAFGAAEPPSGVAFAITDAASGGLVGCCGVDDWSKGDVAQFGYWIGPSARGRGYATRAVVLLTPWLFELGAARVFLTVEADNEASAAVARRAGFVHEGTMRAHSVWQGERIGVMWFAALRTNGRCASRTNQRDVQRGRSRACRVLRRGQRVGDVRLGRRQS